MATNNIILTGGHAATTAIAVIHEIKKIHPGWKLFWVGPRSAVEGKMVPTLASRIMPNLGVTYVPLTSGRLQRKFTVWTILSLLKIPIGIISSFWILVKIKPDKVISFGGYASVPVCFMSWILRIPVFVHEQTVVTGRANRINAFFAKKIFVARQQSKAFFPSHKTFVVGNPVSFEISKIKPKEKMSSPPVIYITGGSSGAQRINEAVLGALEKLLAKYKVIHQTGSLDFDKFKKLAQKGKYEVYDFIDPKNVPGIFEKADLIISRAGANTLSEILVARRPAILIPIPWTAYDEQTKNAMLAVENGLGVLLAEKDLSPNTLLTRVDGVFDNWKKMVKSPESSLAILDKNAAQTIVSML